MGRYTSQVRHLDQTFGKKIRVFNKIVDSKILLENADVFVGSGGTMTAESALLSIALSIAKEETPSDPIRAINESLEEIQEL